MAYISTDQRTQVLIETIEDAEKSVGNIDTQSVNEKQAHRLAVAFSHVLATAKRHPYWPEPEEPEPVVVAPPPKPEVTAPQPSQPVTEEDIPF